MKLRFESDPASSRLSLLILAATLTLSGQCASAATYYISTGGSDSNAGTQSAPFRHLSKGAAVARAGDTVIVTDGTYDNEGVVEPNFVVTLQYSGTAGNPITFMAQNRGGAILDSGNTSTTTTCNGAASYFNLYNASFIVIQGFVIQHACDSGIQSNNAAHDITFRWNEIRNIANRTVTDQIGRDGIYLNSSEYNFTFDGNIFHNIGRTGGISQLHFDHGIYAAATNLTIINNVFYNMTSGWSIQIDGGSNWLIANNTFAFPNTGDGEAGQIMFWNPISNMTVENNIFYEPNSAALTEYAATITGSTFKNNLIYGVSSVGITSGLAIGTNQIGANPLFVNPTSTSPNFQLQTGSPAIASGLSLAAVADDITGAARPATPSLGAYDVSSGGTINPPPVISGVFTSGVSSNSAAINWSTDQASTSYVQYGLTSYTNTTPTDSTMLTQHSISLSGLTASTLYHFRVGSTNSSNGTTLSSDDTVTTISNVVTSSVALTAGSASLPIQQGRSAADAITATLVSGSAVSVAFSTSSLPAGVTAGFSASSCTATCGTTLTFTASATAATGTYNVVVTGSGSAPPASATVAITITASSSGTPDITSGLVAEWKFNEGSGNHAYDASGNVNTATLFNPTWWTSNYGTTAWFGGANSYGSVAESASLEATNQLTVAFWLRPSANANTDPRVISKLYDWDVKLNGANRYPQFSAGTQYATLNYSLPLITWHHVVFTFSAGVVKGYVDGVPVPFLANTFTGTSALAQYMYGLYLATDSSQTNSYIGSLNDVRIYDRALSDADVAALYTTVWSTGGTKKKR
ncbi:MAG TPA: LamG-like jellyroll fold domain-containing protein [Bryobacteraceae bacterium]|nr:LamG-like jellyroll fold domain-containing protein [Bryobacteraceae bacterium]